MLKTIRTRSLAFVLVFLFFCGILPFASAADTSIILTFSAEGITETRPGTGYKITGSDLTITAPGVYTVTGTSGEGTITVNKDVHDAVLILQDLDLASSSTAPVVIKKGASVTIHLSGSNTLTDNEDISVENTDTNFEGACIKVKGSASVDFCGDGSLTANGLCKNGIKGGAESSLVFRSGTYDITAPGNAIASDGSLSFYSGHYTVRADKDGIKSVPEATDTTSQGVIEIFGGSFDIQTNGDGIQAERLLHIHNGSFSIKTMSGHTDRSFKKSTQSAKGLKASGDREMKNEIVIDGGVFALDTPDDAIHSDGDITIDKGSFLIDTADDAIHSNDDLSVGRTGNLDRDPFIHVRNANEGFEATRITVASGSISLSAADDGMNAVSDAIPPFNPYDPAGNDTTTCRITVTGGDIFIDCQGDGLDSNGGLYLSGGHLTVLSQAHDVFALEAPFDADGEFLINGATVFGAGTNALDEHPDAGSQPYATWSTLCTAGSGVAVFSGNKRLFNTSLPRQVNYTLYSDPTLNKAETNVLTLKKVSAIDPCMEDSFSHSWDEGTVEREASPDGPGIMRFSCTDCGLTEYQTILWAQDYECGGHETVVTPSADEGFDVAFDADDGVDGIDIYYTQDYTTPDESGVVSAVSRDSGSGLPDSSGNGQVNFAVRLKAGASMIPLTASDVSGTFKNIKDISTDTLPNLYRITKIESELIVTIRTVSSGGHTHGLIHADRLDAGCTADGHVEYWYCAGCKTYFADADASVILRDEDRILPPTGHVPKDPVRENIVPAGPDAPGSYDLVTYCDNCGEVIESVHVIEEGSLFPVTVSGGSILSGADNGFASAGSTVRIKAQIPSGYAFTSWRSNKTPVAFTDVASATTSFVMPAGEVAVEAVFTQTPAPPIGGGGGGGMILPLLNPVKITPALHGSVSADKTEAAPGEKIVLHCSPQDGYQLKSILVKDAKGKAIALSGSGNEWSFLMPDGPVTVEAEFEESIHICPSETFLDLDADAWYHEYVDYVLDEKLMEGTSADLFKPDLACTRGMIVTILYRLEGKPAVGVSSSFSDVNADDWFSEAATWAQSEKIVNGYPDGTFKPLVTITREQTASILHRYVSFKGKDSSVFSDLSSYDDANLISDWALRDMQWAHRAGLITGRSDTVIAPSGETTRAQLAAMLKRLIVSILKG